MTDKPDPLASLRPPPDGVSLPIPDGPITEAFGCEKACMLIFDSNGGVHFVRAVTMANYELQRTNRDAVLYLMNEFQTR